MKVARRSFFPVDKVCSQGLPRGRKSERALAYFSSSSFPRLSLAPLAGKKRRIQYFQRSHKGKFS